MADLIIGNGEIGKALYNVLSPHYDVMIRDIEPVEVDDVRYLHIAIPFKDQRWFIRTVNEYIDTYKPRITVVHSTVAPKTTEQLTVSAVHSPVIGVHPHLEEGLLTFEKWVCGLGSQEIAEYFEGAGMKSKALMDPNNRYSARVTELGKLLCTTRYGHNIAFAQEMARMCRKYDVNYRTTVTQWIDNYNAGYQKLGMSNVTQPNLYPGVIGGHCVIPNIRILEQGFESDFFNSIIKSNNFTRKNKELYEKYKPQKPKD